MSHQTQFHADPQGIPGPGGAYVRGESSLPPGAVWIPCASGHRAVGLRHLAAMGTGVAGLIWLMAWPLDHWLGWSLLTVALALGLAARRPRPRTAPSGGGLHGMLLMEDRLVYRVGDDCAVVLRTDIEGVERRKRPGGDVAGAVVLAGRTGRGALLCPQPGGACVARLQAWWARRPSLPSSDAPTAASSVPSPAAPTA